MADIQSVEDEIRRGKKRKNKLQHENIMVCLFHRATIKIVTAAQPLQIRKDGKSLELQKMANILHTLAVFLKLRPAFLRFSDVGMCRHHDVVVGLDDLMNDRCRLLPQPSVVLVGRG